MNNNESNKNKITKDYIKDFFLTKKFKIKDKNSYDNNLLPTFQKISQFYLKDVELVSFKNSKYVFKSQKFNSLLSHVNEV